MSSMNSQYLKNKNILFISPSFFGYERDIIAELKSKGANVIYFKEIEFIPFHQKNRFYRFFNDIRVNRKKSLFQVINSVKFDILFVIKGISFDDAELDWLKNMSCKKILYQYDSSAVYPQIERMIPYFDQTFTFDISDYHRFRDTGIKFRPLFFSEIFTKKVNTQDEYLISSVCSFYPERYEIIKRVSREVGKDKACFHVYIPKLKLLRNFYKIRSFEHIRTYTLNRSELIKVMCSSKCILDIEKKNQKGLTIRTLETLGMGNKLITTNKEIVNYDFYHPNNIMVLTERNTSFVNEFLSRDTSEVPDNIKNKYAIEQWCFDIFMDTRAQYLTKS